MAHLLARTPAHGISPLSVEDAEFARYLVTADGNGLNRAFSATAGGIPSVATGETITLVKRVSHFNGGGFTREYILVSRRGSSNAGTRARAIKWANMIGEPVARP